MSLSYTVKATPLSNPTGNLLGFCDLIIDDNILIPGFKVWKKKDGGMFVAPPSAPAISGNSPEGHLIPKLKEDGKPDYKDQIRFVGPKDSDTARQTILQTEILEEMLSAFQAAQKGGAAPAPEVKRTPPPAVEKPVKMTAPTVKTGGKSLWER